MTSLLFCQCSVCGLTNHPNHCWSLSANIMNALVEMFVVSLVKSIEYFSRYLFSLWQTYVFRERLAGFRKPQNEYSYWNLIPFFTSLLSKAYFRKQNTCLRWPTTILNFNPIRVILISYTFQTISSSSMENRFSIENTVIEIIYCDQKNISQAYFTYIFFFFFFYIVKYRSISFETILNFKNAI